MRPTPPPLARPVLPRPPSSAARRATRFLRNAVVLPAAGLALAGCSWVDLAYGALTYPTAAPGTATNVVVHAGHAYLALGEGGIASLRLDGDGRPTVTKLADMDSVDDLAIADGMLFALDARSPGHLGVFALDEPLRPRALDLPLEVDVGPFSGVAAAAGRVVVSGGTGRLSLRRYTADGYLERDAVTADLGRGQPDVALAADGALALVSTHELGPRFALAVLPLDRRPLVASAVLPLDTFGFTLGGSKPANFPIEVALADRAAFVAHRAGLAILALEGGVPRLQRVLTLPVEPVNVDHSAGLVAAVGSAPTPMLVLLDAAEPLAPRPLAALPLPADARPTGVAIAGNRVVVAAGPAGVQVYDRINRTWTAR